MIKDEILSSIDEINDLNTDATSCVMESIILSIDKYCSIYQESSDANKKGTGVKIIEGIKKIFKMISSIIKKVIDKLKSLFRKHDPKKDVNNIAQEVIGDTAVQEAYIMESKQGVDYLTSHGKTPTTLVDDIYVQFIGNDTIRINFNTAEIDAPRKTRDSIKANNSVKNSYSEFDMFYRIVRNKDLSENFGRSFDNLVNDLINNKPYEADMTACKRAYRAFDTNKRKDDRDTFGRPTDNKFFELNLKDLSEFQSFITRITETSEKISKDVYSTLDQNVISFLSDISRSFIRLQMNLNIFSNAIDANKGYVALKYRNKIKTPEKLGEFVRRMLDVGISPKYISYNAWLVANKTLRGKSKHYEPIAGQSRMVLFPEDESIVYKIAMSGFGAAANNNEERVTKMVKNTPVEKHFALVLDSYANGAVVKQQRAIRDWRECPEVADGNGKIIDEAKFDKMIRDSDNTIGIVDKIDFWQRDNEIPNPIRVTDLHTKNFAFDTRKRAIVIFDYGMLSGNRELYNDTDTSYNLRKKRTILNDKKRKNEISTADYKKQKADVDRELWNRRLRIN